MEKWEAVCTAGGYENWCSQCGKQDGGSSKIKNRVAVWFSNPTSESVTREMKSLSWRDFFIHDNSHDIETTSSVHWWVDKGDVVHTQRNTIQPQKGLSAICDNVGESWGYYAKWGKPGKKDKYCYVVTHKWNVTKDKLRNRADWWLPRAVRVEAGERGEGGHRVQNLQF